MKDRQDSRSRRAFLVGAATLGASVPLGLAGQQKVFATPKILTPPFADAPICTTAAGPAAAAGPLKKITFAWNAGAPCLLGVTVAKEKGFFAKHGLDVDLVNYSGSTDQLLETLATGKADAARRHGAALAQADGAGVRRQDRRQHPRRLPAPARADGLRTSRRWRTSRARSSPSAT